jgi:hypothetical protein
MKRYKVTVEREVIVYAPTCEDASRKALSFLSNGVTCNGELKPAVRPIRVTHVARLKPVEKEEQTPIIDKAPARETRG